MCIILSKSSYTCQTGESKIPISVKTGEAIFNKKSIIEYDPKNKVSEAYQDFANEWDKLLIYSKQSYRMEVE